MSLPELNDADSTALYVGRLVLECSRLELLVKLVYLDLVGPADRTKMPSQGTQLAKIKSSSEQRPDAVRFRNWATEANSVLADRGQIVHGSYMGIWDNGSERRGFVHHKTIEEVDISIDRLGELIARAATLCVEGNALAMLVFEEVAARMSSFIDPRRANG